MTVKVQIPPAMWHIQVTFRDATADVCVPGELTVRHRATGRLLWPPFRSGEWISATHEDEDGYQVCPIIEARSTRRAVI